MDVGSELRQNREQRALSLHELSARTKINVAMLRAIEHNEIDRLPGGIFTRGYLKACARELGLDPADTAERYVAQFEPPPSPPADVNVEPTDSLEQASAFLSEFSGAVTAILAVAVLVACYVALSRLQTLHSPGAIASDGSAAAMVSTAGVSQPAAAEARAETATTGVVPGTGLRIELQAAGETWVSAAINGTRVIYRLMQAGERQTIEVTDAFVLRVGDPASLGLAINGQPGRPLGRAGEAVTVTITPENYRDFLP